MSTAFCYDPEHRLHRAPGHPEQPARIDSILERLRQNGTLDRLVEITPKTAPREALNRVHPEDYVLAVEAACLRGIDRLDVDTYITEASFRIALRALGGLLGIVDAVLTQRVRNGFALTRPPGHHARPFAAMGFCLFGNVAAAARHAQRVHKIERVLIVDFDVHHGNGTQEIFYDDPSVLVVSSHQHPCYPGTGMAEETGAGPGEGFTLNIPYPPTTTDEPLLEAYRRLVVPMADRFEPELVLVSAGYDAHHLDPLAHTALSTSGFAEMMRMLLGIAERHCDDRLVATLEGGYHLEALAESVHASLEVMLDGEAAVSDRLDPPPDEGPDLSDLIAELEERHGLARQD